jgi:hypothetical protein
MALNTLERRYNMFKREAMRDEWQGIEYPSFLVTAFANRMKKSSPKAAESPTDNQATRPHRDIGPSGTAARLVVGLLLVGLIVYGQLSSSRHLTPTTWALGLIGFPALVLPVALYLTGWFVPPLWFTSDATLIFVGSSLLLAALRGDAGCEFLALSNWLLRRSDQMACAIFTPIDSLEL